MEHLPIPAEYEWFPRAGLQTGVAELGDLYVALVEIWPLEHKPFRHSTMRSGSSSSSSRFKIRPKQVNASTCDFDRCCLQSGDNTGTYTFKGSYMSTKATAARIYEYGEPDNHAWTMRPWITADPVGHEVLVTKPSSVSILWVSTIAAEYAGCQVEASSVTKHPESSEAVGPSVTLVKVAGQGRCRRCGSNGVHDGASLS